MYTYTYIYIYIFLYPLYILKNITMYPYIPQNIPAPCQAASSATALPIRDHANARGAEAPRIEGYVGLGFRDIGLGSRDIGSRFGI